jgi:hypothetical protein
MGGNGLGFPLAVVAPQRQTNEVFAFGGRIVPQAIDPPLDFEPGTPLSMVMLLEMTITRRQSLRGGEVPPLDGGNLIELLEVLLWISPHVNSLYT